MSDNSKYLYSFYLHPDSTREDIPQAVFNLFRMLAMRLEDTFTPIEFLRFRMDVEKFGITLREISRVPDQAPEIIT